MDKLAEVMARRWRWVLVIGWLGLCAWLIFNRWGPIHGFALGDTDDNLRFAQVRDWLAGQDWYDLRQHRLDPVHGGANIHWSRLVDLPIAALMVTLKPLIGWFPAQRWATAIAPLLPLLPLGAGLALITRRLVDPKAVPLTFVALFFAGSTLGMFQPLRIDHHGWQLAFLAILLAGLADPNRRRGGLIAGVASALSLAIGLEMMIYLALAGAAQVLFWVADRSERERLLAYAASLVLGTGLAFLIFASNDNWLPVCDALSPVWLADAGVAAGALLILSRLTSERWTVRLGAAALAGAVVAGFHAVAFPNCLSRLEGVSPEATRLWLANVKEARPIWRHGRDVMLLTLALPLTGLVGWAMLAWRARGDGDRLRRTLAVAAPALVAILLLAWQTRTGPASQMMALPAAAAIAFVLAPMAFGSDKSLVRVLGTVAAVVIGLGAAVPLMISYLPKEKKKISNRAYEKRIAVANRRCPTLAALHPIAMQPKGLIFTYVDFGPRIIATTHHSAIAGPYHRNDDAIADVMTAFRVQDPLRAKAIMVDKYRSDYVLICPDQSTATIFIADAPGGFYTQLAAGKVPTWLAPVDLGKNSPWKMWRVVK